MWHPDEGLVHTWLDGAASADEARSIEAHIESCDDCRAVVLEARGLIAGSSRIVGALDSVPGNVIPAAPITLAGGGVATIAAPRVRKPSFWSSPALRIAASLLLVVGVSSVVVQQQNKSGSTALTPKEERFSTLQTKTDSLSSSATSAATPAPKGSDAVASSETKSAAGQAVGSTRAREEQARQADAKQLTKIPAGALAVAGAAAAVDSLNVGRANQKGVTADSVMRVIPAPTQSVVVQTSPPVQGLTGQQVQQGVQVQPQTRNMLDALAGKVAALSIDRGGTQATKLEKLPPVVRSELLGRDSAVVGRAEQESLGCYVLTAASTDGDARRISLASLLEGVVELESGPNANSLNTVTSPTTPPPTGVAGATAAGAGAAAGGAGAAGGRGGAAGRGAGGGGGRGGGGGGGGRAGRGGGAVPARVDTMSLMRTRQLGWRMNSADTLEMYVMIDTTRIAISLLRLRDSTFTGVARVTSDSTLGVIGNVVAMRSQCF